MILIQSSAYVFYIVGSSSILLLQGFETRGTRISARLAAWSNLVDSISHAGPLTANPLEGARVLQVILSLYVVQG